jgi:hypothetical protein
MYSLQPRHSIIVGRVVLGKYLIVDVSNHSAPVARASFKPPHAILEDDNICFFLAIPSIGIIAE